MIYQTIEEVQNRISYLEKVYNEAKHDMTQEAPLNDKTEFYCIKPTEEAYKILSRAYIRKQTHDLKIKNPNVGSYAFFFDKSKLVDKMHLDYVFIEREEYKRKLIEALNSYPEYYNDEDRQLKEEYLDLVNKNINAFILEENVCFDLIREETAELREILIKKIDKYIKSEEEKRKKKKNMFFK